MSQKAGLGIHKIDGKAHFEYKGYKTAKLTLSAKDTKLSNNNIL